MTKCTKVGFLLLFILPMYVINYSNCMFIDNAHESPAAPTDLVAIAMPGRIDLEWSDNSLVESGFVVERRLQGEGYGEVKYALPADTHNYDDTQILEGMTYYYRVKAFNSFGDSDYCDEVGIAAVGSVAESIIADHTIIDKVRLDQIPELAVENAKVTLHIAYDHTSHGAQIIGGMSDLVTFKELNGSAPGLYDFNDGGEGEALDLRDDFSSAADLHDYPNWLYATREFLGWNFDSPGDYSTGTPNYNSDYDVVIWSWCWPIWTEQEVNEYLDAMDALRADYPQVTFVYMTARVGGYEEDSTPELMNQLIRQHCLENDLVLYDFNDIERYDPDGTCFGDKLVNDGCYYDSDGNGVVDPTVDRNWAIDWQNAHTEDVDWYECYAPHTQPLNANMKAYAAWWLWARLSGWSGN